MHPDKWPEIKEKVLSSFKVLNQEVLTNQAERETIEIIEFESPLGKIKLEWLKKPKVLGKKTQYSNRIGSGVSVDYILSADEYTCALTVYQWNPALENWQKMDSGNFNF